MKLLYSQPDNDNDTDCWFQSGSSGLICFISSYDSSFNVVDGAHSPLYPALLMLDYCIVNNNIRMIAIITSLVLS